MDNLIVLPTKTMQKKLLGIDYVSSVAAKMKDGSTTDSTKADLIELLRENHSITDPDRDDFEITIKNESKNAPHDFLKITSATNEYLTTQFGSDKKWRSINKQIWDTISNKPEKVLNLKDFNKITETTDCNESEILAVIAQLSSLRSGYLRIQYSSATSNKPVTQTELNQKLKAWWKDKTLSDEEWKEWASSINIKWEPDFKKVLNYE
jgi:hypothetical protein